jgi:hypothetical protein
VIRYFAHATDEGDLSALGFAYCDALVGAGHTVRVIAVELADLWDEHNGKPAARWTKHRTLFAVPVIAPYVNVVCAAEYHWNRLYTVGVRNVLITASRPTPAARHYEHVIVPTPEAAKVWGGVRTPDQISVVPVDLGARIRELQIAVFGAVGPQP